MTHKIGDKVVVRLGAHRGTNYAGWHLPLSMVPDGTETEIVKICEYKAGWVGISACSNSYYPMSLLFPISKKKSILVHLKGFRGTSNRR